MSTNAIREARHQAGLSQQQLAYAAHCSIAYVRLLERGFAPGSSDVLPRVRVALGINEESPEAATPGSLKTSDAGGGLGEP